MPVPAAFDGFNDDMAFESVAKRSRSALSKSMSIDRLDEWLWWRDCVEASRSKFDHGDYLFMRQMEPVHDLANRGSYFEIVKHD
jgi:hypothetical protein